MGEAFSEELKELSSLRQRVDLLAEEARSANLPWYKNTATLISVAALVFSLGTTVVSGWHTTEQDTHNLRTELRGLLQRLAALPKESAEIYEKYKNDPVLLNNLSGMLNEENVILSRQADELLKRLPKDQVSATDYIAVSGALANSRMFDTALVDLKRALAVASPVLDDEVGALRTLAALEMNLGKTGEARGHWQQVADIFGKDVYRGYDQFTKLFTNATTELNWATSEMAVGNWDVVQQHLGKAEQLANGLPNAPPAQVLRASIAQVKSGQQAGTQLTFPAPPAVPMVAAPNVPPVAPRK